MDTKKPRKNKPEVNRASQDRFAKAQTDRGLKKVTSLWAKPEHHQAIRDFAKSLEQKE